MRKAVPILILAAFPAASLAAARALDLDLSGTVALAAFVLIPAACVAWLAWEALNPPTECAICDAAFGPDVAGPYRFHGLPMCAPCARRALEHLDRGRLPRPPFPPWFP
jgi:hypothetical protein